MLEAKLNPFKRCCSVYQPGEKWIFHPLIMCPDLLHGFKWTLNDSTPALFTASVWRLTLRRTYRLHSDPVTLFLSVLWGQYDYGMELSHHTDNKKEECTEISLTFLQIHCNIWTYDDILWIRILPFDGHQHGTGFHISAVRFTYFFLYSSLSRLTLASTLYRALSSGVMVSIWTPTPSGCVHVTPGPCRVS